MDNTQTQVRAVIDGLQRPIPDFPTLLTLLSGPLDCIGLLPPQFRRHNTAPLPHGSVNLSKHIPALQRALLEHIASTWDTLLAEHGATPLLEQYFCPDAAPTAAPTAGRVALLAYATLVARPGPALAHPAALRLLARLAAEYPLDRLHAAVFAHGTDARALAAWEDCVRSAAAVPAKVANALSGGEVLRALDHAVYFGEMAVRCECLVYALSVRTTEGEPSDVVGSVAYLIAKLVNLGIFPTSPPVSHSQPSFFQTTLPTIRARLGGGTTPAYSAFWGSLVLGLPSSFVLQSVLTSLCGALPRMELSTGPAPPLRARVRREAQLLHGVVGALSPEKQELWECVSAIALGRDWDEGYARVFVCWLSGGAHSGRVDEGVLNAFVENVLETWSSPDHIKHSLLSRHRYFTTLLLLAVSYFPASSYQIQSLSFSPAFITGVGKYLAHLDSSVRRCGMLAAEVIAQLAGKTLNFGDWNGDDSGKPWAREVRQLIKQRDVDADLSVLHDPQPEAEDSTDISTTVAGALETPAVGVTGVSFKATSDGYDSDDSITGYASPQSSRSASPTPSELDELEKDPMLNVGLKKLSRPVYLVQLGELLRNTGGNKANDEPHDADKIEMALNYAEELIRKKHAYGTEVDENAVNLVYGLMGLQDNYDLEGFDAKRRNALTALVVCSPRQAAPALIDEFFKNQYSITQRYAALDALALGAREMASLPLPLPTVAPERFSFPSKKLPESLHQKYLTAGNQISGVVPQIIDNIARQAIERTQDSSADRVPELIRERRLRVQKPSRIVEVSSPALPLTRQQGPSAGLTKFTEVAAEFLIAPLINRFWSFLRDEQTREERTAYYEGRHRYHGAGTGLILNPVVLAHFLRTLAILTHAGQNAPEWLAVIAPDSLELAVTLGTRPVSHMETDNDNDDKVEEGRSHGKEASVLTSALELALVVLDGCLELDNGRVMGLEHTALFLGAGEWAGAVFATLEKGLRVDGGGGAHEVKLRRAAAGVLLKVDELTSRWQRSMLDTR